MRGVHYSACSLCYKKIAQFHQKCSLMRDCSLFRRLLLPEYTAQWCVLTNSSPLGVGQAPVENSWGTYKIKNIAQKKLALKGTFRLIPRSKFQPFFSLKHPKVRPFLEYLSQAVPKVPEIKFTRLTWIFQKSSQLPCLLMSLWDLKNASVCSVVDMRPTRLMNLQDP